MEENLYLYRQASQVVGTNSLDKRAAVYWWMITSEEACVVVLVLPIY
jgi:hypothetical protein